MASALRTALAPEDWESTIQATISLWGGFDYLTNVIYCDMDGVVADFDSYIMAAMGRTFSHKAGPGGGDKEMWDFLAKVKNMYRILPPTPYVKALWDAIKAVESRREMLTAIPRRATVPTAEQDKKDWMVDHRNLFGEDVKVNLGPYSRDKWKWAKPCDILIDDRDDNIGEWISAGGIGIYHDGNVERTIELIQQYTKRA